MRLLEDSDKFFGRLYDCMYRRCFQNLRVSNNYKGRRERRVTACSVIVFYEKIL